MVVDSYYISVSFLHFGLDSLLEDSDRIATSVLKIASFEFHKYF